MGPWVGSCRLDAEKAGSALCKNRMKRNPGMAQGCAGASVRAGAREQGRQGPKGDWRPRKGEAPTGRGGGLLGIGQDV